MNETSKAVTGEGNAPRVKRQSQYKWTVEFTVNAEWVADGFNLTDERALAMLNNDLQYASEFELGAKVISAPDPAAIRREQGY